MMSHLCNAYLGTTLMLSATRNSFRLSFGYFLLYRLLQMFVCAALNISVYMWLTSSLLRVHALSIKTSCLRKQFQSVVLRLTFTSAECVMCGSGYTLSHSTDTTNENHASLGQLTMRMGSRSTLKKLRNYM